MPAFRSVVSVLVSFVVRSFSTNSRPACGRPPAAAVLALAEASSRSADGERPVWSPAHVASKSPLPGEAGLDGAGDDLAITCGSERRDR